MADPGEVHRELRQGRKFRTFNNPEGRRGHVREREERTGGEGERKGGGRRRKEVIVFWS